jgi:hypothetical protein
MSLIRKVASSGAESDTRSQAMNDVSSSINPSRCSRAATACSGTSCATHSSAV